MNVIAVKSMRSLIVEIASVFVPLFYPVRLRPLMPKFFLCYQQPIYIVFQLLYLDKIVFLCRHPLCLFQLPFLLSYLSCDIAKILLTPTLQTWLTFVDFSSNICHRKRPKFFPPSRVDRFITALIIQPDLFKSPRALLVAWDAHWVNYDGFMVRGTTLKSKHLWCRK